MYDWTENYYQDDNNVARKITDLDISFEIHPISKDIRKKTNVEAIKQSLRLLVLLNHYEKPFHPDIGSDIYKSLFEPEYDKVNEHVIEENIKRLIDDYEPRAEEIEVTAELQPDNNAMNITIFFVPVGSIDKEKVDIFLRILR